MVLPWMEFRKEINSSYNYLVTFQATKTHLFLLAFLFKEFSLMFPIFRKHHNHKAANNHTFNFVTPC